MKTIRKGAKIKYVGKNQELVKTWGDVFDVFRKEGNWVRVSSVKRPEFGICAVIPVNDVTII